MDFRDMHLAAIGLKNREVNTRFSKLDIARFPSSRESMSHRHWTCPVLERSLRVLFIVIAVGLGPTIGQAGAAFGVDGICTREDFDPKGKLLNSANFEFRIIADGRRLDLILKEAGSAEDYRRVVSDGTNTYYVNVFRTAIERAREKGQRVGENIAGAVVLKRPVPNLASYSPAGEIWLAYASGWYFTEYGLESAGRMRSGEIDLASGYGTASGSDVEALREKRMAFWDLIEPGGVPNQVTFWEGGFARSRVTANGSFVKIALPAAYRKGFTNSHFAVLAQTNTGSGVFPTRSVLTSYWVKKDGVSSNDLWARHVYTIVGTHFYIAHTKDVAPPILPGSTLIVEGRFLEDAQQPKSSFSYLSRTFVSEEQVRSSAAYREAKWRPQPHELKMSNSRSARIFLLVVMAFAAIPLPIFVFLRRRKAV
jgi:hypothetical protein